MLALLFGPVSYVNGFFRCYLSIFSGYYGFNQFVLSLPRRFIFGVYSIIFFYFWIKWEQLEWPITSFKRSIYDYCQGFLLSLSCYFLSELYYWATGYSEVLPFDSITLLKSSVFFVISSGMGSILEEFCFRYILLDSFEKHSNSFLFANMLQALLFASAHLLNPGADFVRFGTWIYFSLITGFLRKITKGIWASVGFHSGDHYGSILNKLTSKTNVYSNNGTFAFHVCMITALLGILLFNKSLSKKAL